MNSDENDAVREGCTSPRSYDHTIGDGIENDPQTTKHPFHENIPENFPPRESHESSSHARGRDEDRDI